MSFIKLDEEIEGDRFFVVSEDDVYTGDTGGMAELPTGSYGTEIHLFKDEEQAGEYAREYWKDFIEDDHHSAIEILGAENLIAWALGKPAGPGTIKVRSLNEWLDLYRRDPSEHFASGPFEIEAIGENIVEKLGFRPTVAYSME
jgi:hypothetical protein